MNKYTDSAKAALRLAERAAKESNSGYVGTEHLLLGLIREPEGVASNVLRQNGITEEKLSEMISSLRKEPGETAVLDRGGYTPRLYGILDNAAVLSQRYHSAEVGTEHLLMALILERQNVAVKLLEAGGANVPKIYFEVLAAIGENLRRTGRTAEEYARAVLEGPHAGSKRWKTRSGDRP